MGQAVLAEVADELTGATMCALPELFARVCARHAERTALTLGATSMSYAELDAATDRVAAGLQAAGIGRGALVAILIERSPAMIAAMLGVCKAGAAYLPMDTRYPAARVRETLDDAAPAAMLVTREQPGDFAVLTLPIEDLLEGRESFRPVEIAAEDRAYVIYTSGSTGKPKGVEVTHGNVARLLSATEPWFGFNERDVWTMFHSFAFDFSVWEIWGCLLTGGRLVIVPFESSRDPDAFRSLLLRESVTVLNQTPSAFALLDSADAAAAGKLALRVVIFGGEALNGRMLRGWIARHGDSHPRLINMYGITETTVHVTYRRMFQADRDEHESLIGAAIPDLGLHLLDDNLQPVEDGREGELCITGAGVARGYLRRPELTAERFVASTWGAMYRSGDMARHRPDGELVYLGRRDGQVKVNGFRVEVGEVEAALLSCPGITQACVAGRQATLAAYFVGRPGLRVGEVSAELATRLPAHMMPARYMQVSALPLNGNGKVDRAALPEIVAADPAGARLQGSEMEQRVAQVWASVLGGPAGLDDNFFDVGGTSLLLVRVRNLLAAELGRSIPVTWMFECTTVRTLAARLETGDRASANVPSNAARQREAFARAKALRSVSR